MRNEADHILTEAVMTESKQEEPRSSTPSLEPPEFAVRPSDRSRSLRDRRTLATTLVFAILAVVGATCGLLFGQTRSTSYTAHAYVLVTAAPGRGGDIGLVSMAAAFERIATDPGVAGPALGQARLPSSPKAVSRSVAAVASPDAPLIEVTGTSDSPVRAAQVAHAAASGVVAQARILPADSGVVLVPLTPATVPDEPSATPPAVLALIEAGVGLAVAGAVYWLRK